jgi:hypothetical protein
MPYLVARFVEGKATKANCVIHHMMEMKVDVCQPNMILPAPDFGNQDLCIFAMYDTLIHIFELSLPTDVETLIQIFEYNVPLYKYNHS